MHVWWQPPCQRECSLHRSLPFDFFKVHANKTLLWNINVQFLLRKTAVLGFWNILISTQNVEGKLSVLCVFLKCWTRYFNKIVFLDFSNQISNDVFEKDFLLIMIDLMKKAKLNRSWFLFHFVVVIPLICLKSTNSFIQISNCPWKDEIEMASLIAAYWKKIPPCTKARICKIYNQFLIWIPSKSLDHLIVYVCGSVRDIQFYRSMVKKKHSKSSKIVTPFWCIFCLLLIFSPFNLKLNFNEIIHDRLRSEFLFKNITNFH